MFGVMMFGAGIFGEGITMLAEPLELVELRHVVTRHSSLGAFVSVSAGVVVRGLLRSLNRAL